MENDFGNLEGFVDAIADRVLGKLIGRPNRGPTGEPMPQLPDRPPGQEEIAFARVSSPVAHSRTRAHSIHSVLRHWIWGRTTPCPSWRSSRWCARLSVCDRGNCSKANAVRQDCHRRAGAVPLGQGSFPTGPTRAAGARVGPQKRLDRTLWDKKPLTTSRRASWLTELVTVAWNPTLNFSVPAWYVRAARPLRWCGSGSTSGEGGTQRPLRVFR